MTQGTAVAALCGDLTALNRRDEEEDSAVHAARGNRDRSRRREGRKAKGPRVRGGRVLAPRPAEREGRTSWSEKLLRHLLHVTALSPAVLCQTERPEHTTGRGGSGLTRGERGRGSRAGRLRTGRGHASCPAARTARTPQRRGAPCGTRRRACSELYRTEKGPTRSSHVPVTSGSEPGPFGNNSEDGFSTSLSH